MGVPKMVNCLTPQRGEEGRLATHQEIAQVSDEELLQRMISSHGNRFDEVFWDYFGEQVGPGLPESPVIADLGCGPGLLLRDLSQRYPGATLVGLDVTRAMIEYAEQLDYAGQRPTYHVCDVTTGSLPLADAGVDLLSMVAVFHVLNDPLSVSREIRRVLSPGGLFLLQDWVRTPLADYLARMTADAPPEMAGLVRERVLRLFPTHNKYTVDDWLWLLDQGGFEVVDYRELNSPNFRTFVCRAA
jgi:SAM-dependent methyltransferase